MSWIILRLHTHTHTHIYIYVCILFFPPNISPFSLVIIEFQEAVKHKPTFPDAYLNLGNVYKVSCDAFCQ